MMLGNQIADAEAHTVIQATHRDAPGLVEPAGSVGTQVRALRRAAWLSLESLAERSGVGVRTLSDIERGVSRVPHPGTVGAIAAGLALGPDERERLLGTARRARRSALVVDRAPTVSPYRLPDFTGRAAELDRVRAHLASSSGVGALVVVSGPAGVGKTTFAVETLAARGAERMRLFVDLEGFGTLPLTPLEIVSTLLEQSGATAPPPSSLEVALHRWRLRSNQVRATILLDNASNEEQVREVLGSTEASEVIVTSRRSLSGLPGAHRVALRVFSASESRALLRRIVPPQQGDERALDDLARLCGDMPLALRIAGNRVASRPNQYAEDLVDRMRPDHARLRALVAGDLSIEAAFNLSYDELSDDGAAFFRALGAIDGPTFESDLAAAAAGIDSSAADRILAELSDLGLVESVGESRFRLHDLVKAFAVDRLDRSGLGRAAHRRSAVRMWVLRTFIRAGASAVSPADSSTTDRRDHRFADSDETMRWVRTEVGHWWPAYLAMAEQHQDDLVLDVASSAYWFVHDWHWSGLWRKFFRVAVETAERGGDEGVRAAQLNNLALAHYAEANDEAAGHQTALLALEAAERAGDAEQRGWALLHASWSSMRGVGDAHKGVLLATEAVAAFSRLGLPVPLFEARYSLCRLRRLDGEVTAALAEHEALLRWLDADQWAWPPSFHVTLQVGCRCNIVEDLLGLGRTDEAWIQADRAVSFADAYASDSCRVFARTERARASEAVGRVDAAMQDLEWAEGMLATYGDSRQHSAIADVRRRLERR